MSVALMKNENIEMLWKVSRLVEDCGCPSIYEEYHQRIGEKKREKPHSNEVVVQGV